MEVTMFAVCGAVIWRWFTASASIYWILKMSCTAFTFDSEDREIKC